MDGGVDRMACAPGMKACELVVALFEHVPNINLIPESIIRHCVMLDEARNALESSFWIEPNHRAHGVRFRAILVLDRFILCAKGCGFCTLTFAARHVDIRFPVVLGPQLERGRLATHHLLREGSGFLIVFVFAFLSIVAFLPCLVIHWLREDAGDNLFAVGTFVNVAQPLQSNLRPQPSVWIT